MQNIQGVLIKTIYGLYSSQNSWWKYKRENKLS